MKVMFIGKNGKIRTSVVRYLNQKYEMCAPEFTSENIYSMHKLRDEILAFNPDFIVFLPLVISEDECRDVEKVMKCIVISAAATTQFAMECGASVIMISTYKVFSGNDSGAYNENSRTNPVTAVGHLYLDAEEYIKKNPKHYILRCGEIFDIDGGILEAFESLADGNNTVRVSDYQGGSFLSCGALAEAIDNIIDKGDYGTYNVANDGVATWFDFATEVFRLYDSDCVTASAEKQKLSSYGFLNNFALSTEKYKNDTGKTFKDWHDDLKYIINEKLMLREAEKAMKEGN